MDLAIGGSLLHASDFKNRNGAVFRVNSQELPLPGLDEV